MKRAFSPATNPAGLTSLIAALYALGTGIWNVAHNHVALDPQVVVAALAAAAAWYTRQAVTPVRDPRDGAGHPLRTHDQHAAEGLRAATERAAVPRLPAVRPAASIRRPPAPEPPAAPDAGRTP